MANMAWRMVIELVAGIAIGFGIGYGLDWLFGTLPIFLILFIGFGFVAGVRTMMRTAQEVQKMHMARAADEKEG
jgi:ATP synthase protein I